LICPLLIGGIWTECPIGDQGFSGDLSILRETGLGGVAMIDVITVVAICQEDDAADRTIDELRSAVAACLQAFKPDEYANNFEAEGYKPE
jgi:hypothetical protein